MHKKAKPKPVKILGPLKFVFDFGDGFKVLDFYFKNSPLFQIYYKRLSFKPKESTIGKNVDSKFFT